MIIVVIVGGFPLFVFGYLYFVVIDQWKILFFVWGVFFLTICILTRAEFPDFCSVLVTK